MYVNGSNAGLMFVQAWSRDAIRQRMSDDLGP